MGRIKIELYTPVSGLCWWC